MARFAVPRFAPAREDGPKPGDEWIARHGNVNTRMVVVDSTDPERTVIRVVDPAGSLAYRKGDERTVSVRWLELYFAPYTRARATPEDMAAHPEGTD
jgi:hypothetical protein